MPPMWRCGAGARQVTIVEAGVGRVAVERALALVAEPCDVLLSFGFAGALIPGLEPGDLVVPSSVTWDGTAVRERYEFATHLVAGVARTLPGDLRGRAVRGTLLSSPVVLATPPDKEAAGVRWGAVAVEMEAAGLVTYAREHGVRLVALRAILDPVQRSLEGLPPDLERSWGARARLMTRPALWPLIMALRGDVRMAAAALTRAARVVLPWLCEEL